MAQESGPLTLRHSTRSTEARAPRQPTFTTLTHLRFSLASFSTFCLTHHLSDSDSDSDSHSHSHSPTSFFHFFQDPWQWAGVTVSTNSSLPAHVMVGMDVGHCRDLHADSPNDPADVTRTRRSAEQWVKKILLA